jgi:hypothetical protein
MDTITGEPVLLSKRRIDNHPASISNNIFTPEKSNFKMAKQTIDPTIYDKSSFAGKNKRIVDEVIYYNIERYINY